MLVTVDRLPEFAIGAAMAGKEAEVVCSKLSQRSFSARGAQRAALSGNGGEFKNALRPGIGRMSNARQ